MSSTYKLINCSSRADLMEYHQAFLWTVIQEIIEEQAHHFSDLIKELG